MLQIYLYCLQLIMMNIAILRITAMELKSCVTLQGDQSTGGSWLQGGEWNGQHKVESQQATQRAFECRTGAPGQSAAI